MSVRPRSSLKGLHRLPLLLIVLTLVALTALAVHARGWIASPPAATSVAKPLQTQQAGSAREAEIITITPIGFEPSEVTRPAGSFILMVDNRSGLEEITFRLDREGGSRVHEISMPREHPDWDGVVDPPPGTYLLTEASHPDWLCRITITAQ